MTESAANPREADSNAAQKGNGTDPKDIMSKPIPGPQHVGPDWFLEPDMEKPRSLVVKTGRFFADLVRKPAHWIRENVVLPNKGPKYYWYHRKFPRALPIDECYMDDFACVYEADLEYERVHAVDRATLDILRQRRDACHLWYTTKHGKYFPAEECQDIVDTFNREETNFHIKYGDLRFKSGVLDAYNKQKCRMIVDRRRALKKQQEEAEISKS